MADPFEALRTPVTPVSPTPAFTTELRSRVMSGLGIVPTVELPERLDAAPTAAAGVAPYLIVDQAARALDWYRDVMGAIETARWVGDDGRVGHAEFTIGAAHFMLADEHPDMGFLGPLSLGGTPVSLHLTVREVDRVYEAAVAAGARGERAPADQSHGNRTAVIVDPFGHRWMLSHPIEGVSSSDVIAANPTYAITGRRPVEPGH